MKIYSTQQQTNLKRYYEETGSNLNTKLTEKIPFFISYKRDGNYIIIGSFDILRRNYISYF